MENNHICIVGLGSNSNKEFNIPQARILLEKEFPSIYFSCEMETMPIRFKNNKNTFLNQIALFVTTEDSTFVYNVLKNIEHQMGRCEEHKFKEIIEIDLDLIKFDDTILKPHDYLRDYVKKGISDVFDKYHCNGRQI